MKPLAVHAAVLVVAAGLAYSVWNKDEPTAEKEQSAIDVWSGSQAAFSKLSFDGKTRKVRLESQKDALGYYYVTTVDKEEAPPVDPHAGTAAAPLKPEGGAEPKKETLRFISVKAGETLVKSLSPLKAIRAVGKVEPARNEEFGLDKPEGTLKVTIDGKEHSLLIGGNTPGGGERYAKYQNSGEVFAISGDIAQSLMFGDSRLPEHDLHDFKSDEVVKVRIQKGGKTRELTRIKEKNEGWGDPGAPGKQDETAGNWMSKVNRLRGGDFVEKPATPLNPASAIVRVEYFDGSKSIGWLELYKLPATAPAGAASDTAKGNDYLVKTEWDRWPVKVVASTAEQIENDLASVLK